MYVLVASLLAALCLPKVVVLLLLGLYLAARITVEVTKYCATVWVHLLPKGDSLFVLAQFMVSDTQSGAQTERTVHSPGSLLWFQKGVLRLTVLGVHVQLALACAVVGHSWLGFRVLAFARCRMRKRAAHSGRASLADYGLLFLSVFLACNWIAVHAWTIIVNLGIFLLGIVISRYSCDSLDSEDLAQSATATPFAPVGRASLCRIEGNPSGPPGRRLAIAGPSVPGGTEMPAEGTLKVVSLAARYCEFALLHSRVAVAIRLSPGMVLALQPAVSSPSLNASVPSTSTPPVISINSPEAMHPAQLDLAPASTDELEASRRSDDSSLPSLTEATGDSTEIGLSTVFTPTKDDVNVVSSPFLPTPQPVFAVASQSFTDDFDKDHRAEENGAVEDYFGASGSLCLDRTTCSPGTRGDVATNGEHAVQDDDAASMGLRMKMPLYWDAAANSDQRRTLRRMNGVQVTRLGPSVLSSGSSGDMSLRSVAISDIAASAQSLRSPSVLSDASLELDDDATYDYPTLDQDEGEGGGFLVTGLCDLIVEHVDWHMHRERKLARHRSPLNAMRKLGRRIRRVGLVSKCLHRMSRTPRA